MVMVSVAVSAQRDTLRAVVDIEGEYIPEAIPVKKMNFTPVIVEDGGREVAEPRFSETARPFGGFVSEKNTKELVHKAELPYNGYARVGYGVANELDIKAAYNYDITESDNINAFVAVDGYRRFVDGELYDWKSRMYNTMSGINYSHTFSALRLDADAGFSNMVFNYQDAGFNEGCTDKQNYTNFRFSVRGASILSGPFAYSFRAGYTNNAHKYSSDFKRNINENRINAGGAVSYMIDNPDVQGVGIDIETNTYLYSSLLQKGVNGYDDYTVVHLAPYIDFGFFDWQLRLGTRMDIRTANGATFSIAPDIKLRRDFSDQIQFFASATGGRKDNSFAVLQSVTPYWNHEDGITKQLKPTYKVVDAAVGSTINIEPLSIELRGGYAYTKDDLLQTMGVSQHAYIYTAFEQQNTHNAHAYVRLGYDLGGWLSVSGDARYDYWSCDNKDLLVLKPEISCNLNAEVRPLENLTLNAGYNFTRFTKSAKEKRVGLKNDLNLRIAYQITPRFGAYVQGDNLLNDSFYEYAGYFDRGARGVIGVTANF